MAVPQRRRQTAPPSVRWRSKANAAAVHCAHICRGPAVSWAARGALKAEYDSMKAARRGPMAAAVRRFGSTHRARSNASRCLGTLQACFSDLIATRRRRQRRGCGHWLPATVRCRAVEVDAELGGCAAPESRQRYMTWLTAM